MLKSKYIHFIYDKLAFASWLYSLKNYFESIMKFVQYFGVLLIMLTFKMFIESYMNDMFINMVYSSKLME